MLNDSIKSICGQVSKQHVWTLSMPGRNYQMGSENTTEPYSAFSANQRGCEQNWMWRFPSNGHSVLFFEDLSLRSYLKHFNKNQTPIKLATEYLDNWTFQPTRDLSFGFLWKSWNKYFPHFFAESLSLSSLHQRLKETMRQCWPEWKNMDKLAMCNACPSLGRRLWDTFFGD